MKALRRIVGALAVLGVALVGARAEANPHDIFGFGSRGPALGNAVSADVSDVSAVYYNPAGLARARGLELSLGYFRASHHLQTNGTDNEVDPVKGLVFGVVAPGELFGKRFAFGLGAHLPDDRISRVRAFRQEQPRWELYDNRNQRLTLTAALAFAPTDWLELGAGLSFMSSTVGRLDIRGSANIFAPVQSQLRHEVDADLTAIRYPHVGARVALSERVALAAVYRHEFQLGLDLSAHLEGDISGLTTATYDLTTSSVNNYLPRQVVLGGSWLVTDALRVNADFTWVEWSAYVAPVASLGVALDIPPPKGGWPSSITPPETPAPTAIVPLRMRNRLVPHLGLELVPVDGSKGRVALRAGYEHQKTPILAQTGTVSYIDRDRHTMSFGLGLAWKNPGEVFRGTLSLDAHAQVSVMPEEVTLKASPADLVGDFRAGGQIWNLGATLTAAFDGPVVSAFSRPAVQGKGASR
ncbi:MAG: outer membrane protein transport protein [Myxococcales bacterium]|nr:outer membrane protein transport protein [Myxococcales bacterium]